VEVGSRWREDYNHLVFYLRPAVPADLPALALVARHLDSVNLPNDPVRLRESIEQSEASFSGALEPAKRELLFVLVERAPDGSERAVGSSMIFAQHGNRRAPHIFFDVIDEERYSESLDRHFRHKVLRIGYNYDGVTEIGGLVLLPELRGHPQQLGKTLVHVRFVYMALNRGVFRDEVVSELLPPLEADGTSALWEALGRHFTGLSYQEADRLSRQNKEFIRALFPQDPIYATLLPPAAQAQIGRVGPHSKAVEKMLVRAGFEYASRIDPFDGGPHFHCRTEDVTSLAGTRQVRVRALRAGDSSGPTAAIVAAPRATAPWFVAARVTATLTPDGLDLPEDTARLLQVGTGDTVGVLAL
jgi:arginine N-succinyltransferase